MKNIKELFLESKTRYEFAQKLGYTYYNGKVGKEIRKIIKDNNLDEKHFLDWKKQLSILNMKYKKIEKECPVCGNMFSVKEGHKKEKTTCSHACANTYFRSGENNPNWKDDTSLKSKSTYVKICFRHHEKKCIVCGETKIVAVHHFDGNRKNNNPKNLIPLCPTHHCYWHSRYRKKIEKIVKEYHRNIA